MRLPLALMMTYAFVRSLLGMKSWMLEGGEDVRDMDKQKEAQRAVGINGVVERLL